DDIIAFMARHGADAGQLRGTIDSFAVNAKIARTKQFIVRSGIDATPTVVVNGKYRVRGRSLEDILRITDQLVARERAAAQASGTHSCRQRGAGDGASAHGGADPRRNRGRGRAAA